MSRIRKIAITGPESTGKSMLAGQLALHFSTEWVPEYARNYLNKLGRPYVQEDILTIARGQIRLEDECEKKALKLMFCDTELIVTKIWSEFKYGSCDPWILGRINSGFYDLFLLCDVDLPWVDDPLREHPQSRRQLFDLYYSELEHRKFPFRVVSGLNEKRLENALKAIYEVIPVQELSSDPA